MTSTDVPKRSTGSASGSGKVYATWKPGAEERKQMIRVAAYFIAERDGFRGDEAEHWAAAEYHIDQILALRESQEKLQIIIDTALDAMVLMDATGRIVSWNRQAELIFGWPREEALGRSLAETIVPPRHREAHRRGMERFFASGESSMLNSRIEVEAMHRDGREFPVELSVAPIRLAGKYEFSAFIRDISARKLAEADVLRSNAELERFSYAISHDMRQPLRMISSYLQLLDMGLGKTLDAEKREYLMFAAEGAQRLDRMLVGLLEYSRVGRKGEPPVWVESRALLDEALLFLQPAITEAQAEVRIAGDWPKIHASPDEMLRLMQNLVANALKFRVEGRAPVISISGRNEPGEWRLRVADNGIGIVPGQADRLFHVFQRLQPRAAYEGNGIGLALCRKIAERHGGRIWVESGGEGEGSTFQVALPQAHA